MPTRPPEPEIGEALAHGLDDPRSGFSIGSLGAIAEFHRGPDEPFERLPGPRLGALTPRGGLRIELSSDVTALAYETLSGRRGRWQHGIVFCRPKAQARAHARTTITELGPDRDAIRDDDCDALLFDIGLGAANVDFCVRTADRPLIAALRRAEGKSIFAPGNPAMAAILEASPHRVAIGALGRAEVFQAIARDKTPEGPHTHVLPKLLKSGRTHSANVPVPAGLMPCLSLYPPNPLADAMGRPHAYDGEAARAFDTLLRRWGHPDVVAEKDRLVAAVTDGATPDGYPWPRTRRARTAARIALRQIAAREPDRPDLEPWLRTFDPPTARRGI
jgi:hypothetical protein